MEPLNEISDVIYRLIYQRSFREAFIRKEYTSLNLSSEILEDLESIDLVQLNKTSQQVIQQFITIQEALPIIKAWVKIFPQDPQGFELIYLFLESTYFELVQNIASEETSRDLFTAFRLFLRLKIPDNQKFHELRVLLQ